MRTGITCAIAWAVLLATAGPAAALEGPNGRLTQVNSGPAVTHSCISEDGSGGACANGRALSAPTQMALAISSDGEQIYAGTDAGIAVLQRDSRTGATLQSFAVDGCFNFLGMADSSPCGKLSGPANPMDGVSAIAVSNDGLNVYATVSASNALLSFHRDPVTGALVPLGDAIGGGLGTTCAALDPGTPADTAGCDDARAIDDPGAVAVSPDGQLVYVSSAGSDAVAVFARGAGGTLSQLTSGPSGSNGCISATGSSEDGAGTCATGNATVLSDSNRMPLAVAPDSADVFVGGDGGILDLQRGPSAELFESGCMFGGGAPPPGCAASAAGTDDPTALAVAPDGSTLYSASATDDALAYISRSGAGSLNGPGACVGDAGSGCADPSARALTDPEGIALSPDGANVYVASGRQAGQSSAVATFDRQPSGAVVQQPGAAGCTAETPGIPADTAGCADGKALTGSVSVVAASDGNHVYTGALSPTNGVAAFIRTSPPETAFSVAPPHVGTRRRARFVVISNESFSGILCHLDKQPERFCDVTIPTPKLKYGLHRFEAAAIDLSGQVDPTPVVWFFAVQRKCKKKGKGKKKAKKSKKCRKHGKKKGKGGGKKGREKK